MLFEQRELSQPFLDDTARQLLSAVQIDAIGNIVAIQVPVGWKEIDPPKNEDVRHPYKIKMVNPTLGLFVKKFPPKLEAFAQNSFESLQILSRTKLKTPVIFPLGVSSGLLFFPLGTPERKERYLASFTNEDIELIEKVLQGKNLTGLTWVDKVDIINISGKEFAADPFDDSANAISHFLNDD